MWNAGWKYEYKHQLRQAAPEIVLVTNLSIDMFPHVSIQPPMYGQKMNTADIYIIDEG